MTRIVYGLYEQILNTIINEHLSKIDHELMMKDTEKIGSAESSKILSDYLQGILREVFNYIDDKDTAVKDRIDFCNSILIHIAACIEKGSFGFKHDPVILQRVKGFLIKQDGEMLLSLIDKRIPRYAPMINGEKIIRPETSLRENSLFTGALHEPSMVSELKKEILTSDRIDVLVSFIKWSGLRLIIEELKEFTINGGKLRVITTSYLGATDYKAIEKLSQLPNTEIHISYDTERTRLHAKTYVFWRDTGFSTVYIGSSNVSESAMTSGLEWNIKLSQYDSGDILEKIRATFEGYWNNPEFVPFVSGIDKERLRKALRSERKGSNEEEQKFSFLFDIKPYYYQQEILDKLQAEREIHGSFKNLVVAATGTGKTVIVAFDYRDFRRKNPGKSNRLLFVAHRKEILNQSLDCFRGILKDLNFGAMMVGGERPESIDHLFVSIQSFNSQELIERTAPDFYDYIVVDEFHHAAAPSYQALLEYYQPKILLGLTATPERMDGASIYPYFNGRVAAEIRLFEAIERKLLSPFHYFGVTDSVNLSNIRWEKGRYDESSLENVYVFEQVIAERRVGLIVDAIDRYGIERSQITGIGFCVSKKHAQFMSDTFNKLAIPSEFLTADSSPEIRDNVKSRLVNKEINFVFVVDIYNEGVDIPEINTVLFLRPTESLTVFLQQLGRGLRLTEGKEALTVLDFVGQARQEYSFFEEKFRALLSRSRKTIEGEIRAGFINVPKGCSIQLEKMAQEYILENIKNAINNKKNLLRKLKDLIERKNELQVEVLFTHYHVNPRDVYGRKSNRFTVSGLAVQGGLLRGLVIDSERESQMALALGRLSFANSRHWLSFLLKILPELKEKKGSLVQKLSGVERIMLTMFHYTLWGKGIKDLGGRFRTIEEAIFWALQNDLIYRELMDLLAYQYKKIDFLDKPLENMGFACPLDLYCAYTLDQILVALGRHTEEKKSHFQEGVLYLKEKRLDVFFVTLNKSEKDYSPSTMYHDYSINEELFHWQSQGRTTIESPTGQRYINQRGSGGNVLFFVREYNEEANLTSPYICLGLADYQNHYGSAPVSIVWKMREAMPGFVMQKAAKV